MIYSNDQKQGGRPYQEDYYGVFHPPSLNLKKRGSLFVISDGMGGKAHGATASVMVVEYFRDHYYSITHETPENADIPDILDILIPAANKALLNRGLEDKKLWGMGATLVAAVIQEDRLFWGSVGDSHLWLIRDNTMTLLNRDHSIGGEIDRRRASEPYPMPRPVLMKLTATA